MIPKFLPLTALCALFPALCLAADEPDAPLPEAPPVLELPQASQRETLTLNQALSEASKNNLGIVLADLAQDDAKNAQMSAWAPFSPRLDLSFSTSRDQRDSLFYGSPVSSDTRFRNGSATLSGGFWTGTSLALQLDTRRTRQTVVSDVAFLESDTTDVFNLLSFTINQSLLAGFGPWRGRAGIDAARLGKESSALAATANAEQVLSETVLAWSALLTAQEARTLAHTDIELARKQREAAVQRIQSGLLAPSEIHSADASIASSQAALLAAHRSVLEMESQLHQVLGRVRTGAQTELLLESMGSLPQLPQRDLEPSQMQALDANPELRAQRKQLEANRVALRASTQGLLPTLDLTATLSANGFGDDFPQAQSELTAGSSGGNSLGLRFSMPLLGLAERSQHRSDANQVRRALAQLQSQEQALLGQVEVAWWEIRNRQLDEEVARRGVLSATQASRAAEIRFDTGQVTLQQLLEARQVLAQANLTELNARTQRLAAQVRLEALRGTLSQSLGLTN